MIETEKEKSTTDTKALDPVLIFDTTLRDGEQCPGASMTEDQKLEVAHRLESMGVDIIEAGFPISSPVQFNAVSRISREISNSVIAGLARAVRPDIESAAKSLKDAKKKRIHTFLASSPIHMQYKLGKEPAQVLKMAVEAVKMARDLVEDVEFSPEDATRSEWPFLVDLCSAVIEAGATTINVPDTVGYTTPEEYGALFAHLIENCKGGKDVIFSSHCHNDLGMATANSLAAVQNGARQIECTINGIGERAGNTAMEEVVMAIRTRGEFYNLGTNIKNEEIYYASKLVRSVTGMVVQPNKAIVGDNAFAHESGIHQDGVLKNRLTYEIMTPQSIGLESNKMILGRHSGRAGFKDRVAQLGYALEPDELESAYKEFLELADKKKEVYDEDLRALLDQSSRGSYVQRYKLLKLQVSTGMGSIPTATVLLQENLEDKEETHQEAAIGDGPVDAIYNAVKRAINFQCKLKRFRLQPVSEGQDAQGVAVVVLHVNGQDISGRGTSTDILEAAALAFLEAINKSMLMADKVPLPDHGV